MTIYIKADPDVKITTLQEVTIVKPKFIDTVKAVALKVIKAIGSAIKFLSNNIITDILFAIFLVTREVCKINTPSFFRFLENYSRIQRVRGAFSS